MDRNDIIINVQVNGVNELTALSTAMRQVNASLTNNIAATKNLDAGHRALNIALGRNESSYNSHAKSISQVVINQSALGNELRRANSDLTAYTKGQLKNTDAAKVNAKYLDQYTRSLKGIKSKAFVEDLRSMTVEMKRLGKDAQFTGRSMIIGLTTPILALGRVGLNALVSVDNELVRLNKLIDNIAKDTNNAFKKMGISASEASDEQVALANKMVDSYKEVNSQLESLSRNFGTARQLVTAVAGDFAELGLSANDSILALTKLTLEAEKLGNMDIGPSKDLVQSVYAQASTIIQQNAAVSGKFISQAEMEAKAIAITRGQLYLFNQIENSTSLSLEEITRAFPEVAAAATQFGISMSEATGFLAPLKSAGFDIGVSATAIKVSLQRLNDPTIKTTEIMKTLTQTTGYDFQNSTRIGLTAIDSLAQGYSKLIGETKYGTEGATEFFGSLFGVRQATRMKVMIENLALFNKALQETGDATGKGRSTESFLAQEASNILKARNAVIPVIKTFSDIGAITRMASASVGQSIKYLNSAGKEVVHTVTQKDIDDANAARQAVADIIDEQRRNGVDILTQIKTQSGKAFFVEFAGPLSAQARAQSELETALGSLKTKIDQIKVAFKSLASGLIEGLMPALDLINKAMSALAEQFKNMNPLFKVLIAGFLAATAMIGPLVFAFGQMKLVVSTVLGTLLKFAPGLSHLSAEMIAGSPALLRLRKPIQLIGESFETTASKMDLIIAKFASMNNPIGRLANKFGELTGVLKKVNTVAPNIADDINLVQQSLAQASNPSKVARAGGLGGLSSLGTPTPTSISAADMDKLTKAEYRKLRIAHPMNARNVPQLVPSPYAQTKDGFRAFFEKTTPRPPTPAPMPTYTDFSKQYLAKLSPQARNTKNFAVMKAQRKQIAKEWNALVNQYKLDVDAVDVHKKAIDNGWRRANAAQKRGIKNMLAGLRPGTTASMTPAQVKALMPADIMDLHKQDLQKLAAKNVKVSLAKAAGIQQFEDMTGVKHADFQDFRKRVGPSIKRKDLITRVSRGSAAGVSYGAKGATLFGKELTEKAERSVVKGGLGGALTREIFRFKSGETNTAVKSYFSKVASKTKSVGSKAMSVAGSGIMPLGNALKSAKASQAALAASFVGMQAGPGIFARMSAAVKGFSKSLVSATKFTKVFGMALMATGVVAVLIGIAAVVVILINKIREGGKTMDGVKKTFKEAWSIIKIAIKAVIEPIRGAIGALIGLAGKGDSVGSGMQGIANTVKSIAESVSNFITKYIVPLIKFVMTQAVDLIKGVVRIVKGFIEIFQGDWKKGLANILKGIIGFVRVAINIFFGLINGYITLYGFMYKTIVSITFKLSKGVVNILRYLANGIIDLFMTIPGALMNIVGKSIEWIADKVGGFISKIPGFGKVGDVIKDFGKAINQDLFTSVGNGIQKLGKVMKGGVNTAADATNSALDTANKFVNEKVIDNVTNIAKKGVGAIKDLADKGINTAIGKQTQLMDMTGKKLIPKAKKIGEDVAEAATEGLGEPIESLGDKIQEAVQSALKDIKQKFVDEVLSNVKDSMDKATEGLTSALEKQKEAAMSAFDQQIEGLEQLQKAEESLTKEREYQAERRRIIQERELQVQNYQRNRALAIYEGRIDDARILGLEELKNSQDYSSSLKGVDESRNRDLAQENLEALRGAIEKAREEADKFFTEQIENFREAAAEITRFPPQTIEEYRAQLAKLNAIATEAANKNGDEFAGMVTNMVSTINDQMPNQAIPAFSNQLDELIQVAQDKYGFQPNSMNGALVAALANMGSTIGNDTLINSNFTSLVEDMRNSASLGFSELKNDIVTPALSEISKVISDNNPFKVFADAIKNANETLLRDMQSSLDSVASKVKDLVKGLDPVILKFATMDARLQAIAESAAETSRSFMQSQIDLGLINTTPAPRSGSQIPIGSIRPPTMPRNENAPNMARAAELMDGSAFAKGSIAGSTWIYGNNKMYRWSPLNNLWDRYTPKSTVPANVLRFFGDPDVKANGGRIKSYSLGGYSVPGFGSTAVPAILHGGEYVINSKAVNRIGLATLETLNNMRFKKPSGANYGGKGTEVMNSTSNVNIYVENFIGEDQWFNEMIKKYNMTVLPSNQKKVGLESRLINSYNGLSRGM